MNKSLMQLTSIKTIIFLWMLTVFVIFAMYAYENYQYNFCILFSCLADAAKELSILGSITAFIAGIMTLISLSHRSDQTSTQIKEFERSNNFNIFIKHREEFSKHIDSLNMTYLSKNLDESSLYRIYFPNSREGSLELSFDIQNVFFDFSKEIVAQFCLLNKKNHLEFTNDIKSIVKRYCQYFGVYIMSEKNFNVDLLWKYGAKQNHWQDTILAVQSVIVDLNKFFEFEPPLVKRESPELLRLLELDFKNLEGSPPKNSNETCVIESEEGILDPTLYLKLEHFLKN